PKIVKEFRFSRPIRVGDAGRLVFFRPAAGTELPAKTGPRRGGRSRRSSMLQVLAAQSLPQTSKIIDGLTTAQVVFPIALCVIGALLMIFGYKAYRWIVLLNFIALGWLVGE